MAPILREKEAGDDSAQGVKEAEERPKAIAESQAPPTRKLPGCL